MTIPNMISVFRLVLVPIVILMILREEWLWAFALCAIAGISDGIDGYIARHFDMCSAFGAAIDPLADKALLVSVYITLAVVGIIPSWLAIVVVSRDIMILMAFVVAWMMAQPLAVKPLYVSKVTTVVQITYAAVLLGALAFTVDLGGFADLFALLVLFLTLTSAGLYLARWLK
jgi:cardiolipin synthase (CMP-forming)